MCRSLRINFWSIYPKVQDVCNYYLCRRFQYWTYCEVKQNGVMQLSLGLQFLSISFWNVFNVIIRSDTNYNMCCNYLISFKLICFKSINSMVNESVWIIGPTTNSKFQKDGRTVSFGMMRKEIKQKILWIFQVINVSFFFLYFKVYQRGIKMVPKERFLWPCFCEDREVPWSF